MKVAYKHLLRFLPENPNKLDISKRLFQLGHEHQIDKDIFDFEFTPNRGDCLSLMGIARDLNIFYNVNLEPESYGEKIPSLDLDFTNKETISCPRISFLHIEIEEVTDEYKSYLSDYFEDLGLKRINFFTDISNFLAYELGQPTHCYDFKKISPKITLKKSHKNSEFSPLFGKEINLHDPELVFTDKKSIINLAGVMGSKSSGCNKSTKSVLVECAYFKPEAIIGKTLKYNFVSDAAYKFERGVDPNSHEKVLRRFIQIVSDHTCIKKLGIFTKNSGEFQETSLDFDLPKINQILGTDIEENFYKKSLRSIGFKVDDVIKVPSFRNDISHQNDIAEEIARIVGYDNLPTKKISINFRNKEKKDFSEEIIRELLFKEGFSEVINFPFCSDKSIDSLKIDNPLDSNKSFLRTNLQNSLLQNLVFNENRQKDLIKFYEVSNIYLANDTPKQQKCIGILVSGRKGNNHIDFSRKLDSKYLIDIFKVIGLDVSNKIKSIDRSTIKSKIKNKIFYIEFSLNKLNINPKYFEGSLYGKEFVKYKPVSEFPSSTRDLSFSVKDSNQITNVLSFLSKYKSEILKKSFLFDYYFNETTQETKIGYRFIFQSSSKTLEDNDVEIEIGKILSNILSLDSVDMPGRS